MPNLSPFSYLLLALIGLMGIAGLWSDAAYPWWRIGLAGYLLGLTYEWIRVRSLKLDVSVPALARVGLGRRATLPVRIVSHEPLPVELSFAVDLPDGFEASRAARAVTLEPEETRTVEVAARPLALGAHEWNRIVLLVTGPLRLAGFRKTIALDGRIEVVPDQLASAQPVVGQRAGLSSSRHAGGGMELDHLREYRPGDPRHTIDWKASARSGQLITRVFSEDQHLEVMLVLDAGRTSRTRVDGLNQLGHYVNFAARFAERVVANEDRVGLIVAAERPTAVVPPLRGRQAVLRIRSELTRLTPRSVESDLLVAALELGRVVRHRCLVVVLTELLGGGAIDGRLMQSVRLWAPRHLTVVVGLLGEELRQMGHGPATDWRDPYTGLAAGIHRRDLARSVQGFRRLGAQALLAQPRDLERSVVSQYETLRAQRRV